MAGQDLSQDQIRRMNAMLEELASGGLLDGVSDEDKADPQYVTDLYTKQIVDPRANQFTVGEETTDGVANAMSFENHYGGRTNTFTATEEERHNSSQPPGGDYYNWQWAGGEYGWIYKGNPDDGTRGKSSYLTDSGQRVHYDPVDSLQRDTQRWDSQRPTIGLDNTWAAGGDQFLREGGRYNRETNPYVYTPQPYVASGPSSGIYDPATNTTSYGGMSYQGDRTQSKGVNDYSAEDWNFLNEGRYYTGKGQLTPEGYGYIKEAGGGGTPFSTMYEGDMDRALGYLGDSNWNPFYANKGQIHQDMIDRDRELGNIGEGLTDYEKRKEGNIADYMYNAFSDSSMIKHRGTALRNWNSWKDNSKINEKSLYSRRMDQGTFNRLGLGDMGLTFDSSYGRPNGANVASGGFNKDVNQGGSAPTRAKQGGFLETYLKRQQEIKPSVMSLMQELEDS